MEENFLIPPENIAKTIVHLREMMAEMGRVTESAGSARRRLTAIPIDEKVRDFCRLPIQNRTQAYRLAWKNSVEMARYLDESAAFLSSALTTLHDTLMENATPVDIPADGSEASQ